MYLIVPIFHVFNIYWCWTLFLQWLNLEVRGIPSNSTWNHPGIPLEFQHSMGFQRNPLELTEESEVLQIRCTLRLLLANWHKCKKYKDSGACHHELLEKVTNECWINWDEKSGRTDFANIRGTLTSSCTPTLPRCQMPCLNPWDCSF